MELFPKVPSPPYTQMKLGSQQAFCLHILLRPALSGAHNVDRKLLGLWFRVRGCIR